MPTLDERLVINPSRDIPIAGTFVHRTNSKGQVAFPKEWRRLYRLRQGVRDNSEIVLFMRYDKESDTDFIGTITDVLERENYNEYTPIKICLQGRVYLSLAPACSDITLVGKGDCVHIYEGDQTK